MGRHDEVNMKMRKLLERWQSVSRSPEPRVTLELALRQHDAARVYALAEMHPGLGVEEILGDIIHAALDELQPCPTSTAAPRSPKTSLATRFTRM